MLYREERESLLAIINDLLKFRLLDVTGGLLAQRCGSNGEHLLFSANGASFRRWHLGLEDFIVTDLDGNVVERHQRGAAAGFLIALELFKLFPACHAVLHTHAGGSHAFAALDRSVPQAAHLAQTLGEVPCIRVEDQKIKEEYYRNPYPVTVPDAMANRPDIVAVNQQVVPQLKGKLGHRAAELERHGLAFTLYQHGIYVFARNIDEAFNNLARIEASALTYIYGSLILQREQHEGDGQTR